MLQTLISQFMQSPQGGEILQSLSGHGLNPDQAQQAVTATAEAAAEHVGGSAGNGASGIDLLGMAGNLLGGAGGGAAGGLGSLVSGFLGGGSAPAAGGISPALAGLVAPIAEVVAKKTGLSPAIAQSVVGVVLPKILSLLGAKG